MNKPSLTITAYGETVTVTPVLGYYDNGRLAIRLVTEDEPWATVTVNLPDDRLNHGEVFVKTWAENADTVIALLEAGWLERTGRVVQSGFVQPEVMCPSGVLAAWIEAQS